MAKKQNASKSSNLKNLVVTAGCKVQVINEKTFQWQTIAETCYTPRHINEVLKTNKLTSAWVVWMCGREMWTIGEELAEHA